MFLYITLFFIFGLILGSFANVCIHRIPRDKSIVFPASYCPECGGSIAWYDNIPVLSYLNLKGKCRQCAKRIPLKYPVIELACGVLSAVLFVRFHGDTTACLISIAFMLCLLILSVIDLELQIIPDSINLLIFLIAIGYSFFNPAFGETPLLRFIVSLGSSLLMGGIFICVTLAASKILKKEALGGGDVKLIFAMSALLGVQRSFVAIFIASLFGSIIGVTLILTKKINREEYIPFGPFLALGAYLSLLLPTAFTIW